MGGHLGAIWGQGKGKPTAIIYIRPQRYTKQFVDNEELFTLSFFNSSYKKDLAYLGTHSGRNEDKLSKTRITPVFEKEYTYFNEAELVLVCRKIYKAPIIPEGFIDTSIIKSIYPEKDFHDKYIGEIIEVLSNKKI